MTRLSLCIAIAEAISRFHAVCFISAKAVSLEACMSLFTQLLGDQITAADTTKSE